MLHRAGIVHRDIKPANIMLDSYGRPVLADFGVASPIGVLADGVLDGFSVLWAPPEQQDQRTHIHPTQDVWALASTTWTLLTGRSPFEDPFGDNSAVAVALRIRLAIIQRRRSRIESNVGVCAAWGARMRLKSWRRSSSVR